MCCIRAVAPIRRTPSPTRDARSGNRLCAPTPQPPGSRLSPDSAANGRAPDPEKDQACPILGPESPPAFGVGISILPIELS